MREGFFDSADISRDEVFLGDAPDDLENSDSDDDMFTANMTLKLGTNSPDDLENPDSDDCLSIANMTLELGEYSPNDSTEATIYMDQVIGSGFFKNACVCCCHILLVAVCCLFFESGTNQLTRRDSTQMVKDLASAVCQSNSRQDLCIKITNTGSKLR